MAMLDYKLSCKLAVDPRTNDELFSNESHDPSLRKDTQVTVTAGQDAQTTFDPGGTPSRAGLTGHGRSAGGSKDDESPKRTGQWGLPGTSTEMPH